MRSRRCRARSRRCARSARAGVTVIFNSQPPGRQCGPDRGGDRTAPASARPCTARRSACRATSRRARPRIRAAPPSPRRYCVIAMAGDQLGDFSDLFNARDAGRARPPPRAPPAAPFAALWGNGWFMLSNPVYGPSLRGNFDDVFPADRRWSDPQGGNRLMPWDRNQMAARAAQGAARRLLRQSRHRHPDARRQQHPGRDGGDAAVARTACSASARSPMRTRSIPT